MRGIFAVVLAAGVGAAAFVLANRNEDPARTDDDAAARLRAADPPTGTAPPARIANAGGRADDQRVAGLVARCRALVTAGDLHGAARVVAESPSSVSDTRVRRIALGLAERLAKDADTNAAAGSEKGSTPNRLAARHLAGLVFASESATAAERDRAYELSRALHRVLLYGHSAPEDVVLRHRVKSGELVWNLSKGAWRRAGITVAPGFVLHVNGISDARRVRAGKTLRVPREELTLLVRKSSFELTVLLGGAPVERFRIGIGASGSSTPAGRVTVQTKLKNPDWYFDGRRIPFDDPENLIGTRWMGFEGDAQAEGIGIHGTSDESTIGKALSAGCIRMHRADVERMFEWVALGTRVDVRD